MAKKDKWREPCNGERIKEYGYGPVEETMMIVEMAERGNKLSVPEVANNERKPIKEVYSNEITEGMVIVAENGGMTKESATTRE